MDEIFAIQRKYCAVEPSYTGATVFPGQNLTRTPGTGVLTPENRLLGISTTAPGLVEFKLIGCVIYQFPTGNEQHCSRFVYRVTRKQRGRPFFPDDFSEIPIDQVTIDPLERADAFKAD
jgi:hypothetical protein